MLAFAFCADPLRPTRVDAAFSATAEALEAIGVPVCTYDAASARIVTRGAALEGARVVYRGWMMNAAEYGAFVDAVQTRGAQAFHDVDAYLSTHHAPRWIPLLGELTPETVFLSADADVESALAALPWDGYVLKDWVKSLKTSRGSIVRSAAEAPEIIAEMRKYRGTIEGGIVARRLEALRPETERRFFVLDGRAWSATDEEPVPAIVHEAARRITASRFHSVDVALRDDGASRIVEVGDGQVSDLVGDWTAARFASMWAGRSDA